MKTDILKLLFTYGIAVMVIAGGGIMLYTTPDQNLQLVLAGFIGAGISFVFGQETAKQATAAAQSVAAQTTDQAKNGS